MRVPFRTEIHGELIAAIDALADRYARFGFVPGEVVELCLYQGLTKTRLGVERMEAERACGSLASVKREAVPAHV